MNTPPMDDPLEAERQRIGAEIHDGLLPYLFAAAAKISSLRRTLSEPIRSNPELSESLDDVADWIDQSRQVARQLMNGVSLPAQATDDPLAAAKSFLRSINVDGETAPRVIWNWNVDSPLNCQLDAGIAAATYRIVCESVRNSVRHAGAETIRVVCHEEPCLNDQRWYRIEVRDDGCGMPKAIDTPDQAHGLGWMKMRAAAAGIELQIDSKADQGTTVLLRLPAKAV